MSLDIIFAEFGDRSKANQKWENSIGRLHPTYEGVKEYFPEANIICYTDDVTIGTLTSFIIFFNAKEESLSGHETLTISAPAS